MKPSVRNLLIGILVLIIIVWGIFAYVARTSPTATPAIDEATSTVTVEAPVVTPDVATPATSTSKN